jgi:hypothetical protein
MSPSPRIEPPGPVALRRWRSSVALKIVTAAALVAMLALATFSWAQSRRARMRAQAELDVPTWPVDEAFEGDLWVFARIRYGSSDRNAYWGGWGWDTDYPDSEGNLSFRLQQLTSMRVWPRGRILELTDPDLFDHPWIYIVEPGDLEFRDDEIPILRRYLLNGGFLMVDDFWGEAEWDNFHREIKRVFPEREPEDVPLSHEIFHAVFDIPEKQQIPNVFTGTRSQFTGVTWERPDAREVHYRAIYDDKQRMMVFICHNTDLGDGWEREGENEYYFREFSEKKAYPLGINVVFYAMTH